MSTTDTKPNPPELPDMGKLGKMLGGLGSLLGKNTKIDVSKPQAGDISINIQGVDQKIALKHIRNMINELIGD